MTEFVIANLQKRIDACVRDDFAASLCANLFQILPQPSSQTRYDGRRVIAKFPQSGLMVPAKKERRLIVRHESCAVSHITLYWPATVHIATQGPRSETCQIKRVSQMNASMRPEMPAKSQNGVSRYSVNEMSMCASNRNKTLPVLDWVHGVLSS